MKLVVRSFVRHKSATAMARALALDAMNVSIFVPRSAAGSSLFPPGRRLSGRYPRCSPPFLPAAEMLRAAPAAAHPPRPAARIPARHTPQPDLGADVQGPR